jgi:HPt (histidine-containing phosphotransfer) domain-containing protein
MDAVMDIEVPKLEVKYEEPPAPVVVREEPPVKKEEPKHILPVLPATVTDMNFLKTFTGGNPEKQKKYVGMFLENAPKLMESIEKALAVKDYPAIKIAAHSLKPQMSYMGIKEDVSKIFLIEQSSGEAAHFDTLPMLVTNLRHLCEKAFEELRNN